MTTAQADISIPVTTGGEFIVVPEDVYLVEFIGFEDGPAFPNRKDPTQSDQTIRLKYKILEGDYADEVIDELASLKGGEKAKLRLRGEALQGRPYGMDETIRLVPLYGKRARAVVKIEQSDKGERNKIESLVALPPPRASRAATRPTAPVEEEDEADEEPQATARPARRGNSF